MLIFQRQTSCVSITWKMLMNNMKNMLPLEPLTGGRGDSMSVVGPKAGDDNGVTNLVVIAFVRKASIVFIVRALWSVSRGRNVGTILKPSKAVDTIGVIHWNDKVKSEDEQNVGLVYSFQSTLQIKKFYLIIMQKLKTKSQAVIFNITTWKMLVIAWPEIK